MLDVLGRPDADPAARRDAANSLARRMESAEVERANLLKGLERAAHELEARVQELSLLRRLSEVLSRVVDGHELGFEVLHALVDEQDLEDAALWMAEGEELVWRCGTGRGELRTGGPDEAALEVLLNEGPVGQTACRREPLVVHDGALEARCRGAASFLREGSFCLFPLASSGRLVGVLWLGSTERYAFPTERVRILGMAADAIAQGLAASELFEKLSNYNENLSEVLADRSQAVDDLSDELVRTKAAMADFWRRLHLGAPPNGMLHLPGAERLTEALRAIEALVAATGGSSGTLHTAAALVDSFARDYENYVGSLAGVSWPVMIEPAEPDAGQKAA
ncbi:MAG: GAF domain-containing protein [Candidatus Eisenbacteria bacterium]|nr:GAF domain-containing protein [Candidatus Eisenbacteria bacterium]